MKVLKWIIPILVFICSGLVYGQNAGTVGIQTVGPIPIFTNATAAQSSPCTVGGPCAIPNIGQSQHTLQYCLNSGNSSISIIIGMEASFDANNWTLISELGQQLNSTPATIVCYFLPGTPGYYPFLRAHVFSTSIGGTSTYSVSYSGATSPGGGIGVGTGSLSPRIPTISSIQANSLQNGTSYSTNLTVTNPASNVATVVLQPLTGSNAQISEVPSKLIVECTATCTFDVVSTSTVGSGCSSLTGSGLNVNVTSILQSPINAPSCGTPPAPSATLIAPITIAANTPFTLDLEAYGIVIPPSAIRGVGIRNSVALTGNMTVQLFWYDR